MSDVINLRGIDNRSIKLNVLGEAIDECSCDPMTGWFRDGTCNTEDNDLGHHVICCVLSDEFLAYSKSKGNDLSTPNPEQGFAGLKDGDHWCLCAQRWAEALEDNKAPQVILENTHMSALAVVSLEQLKAHSIKH